jgi:hypothetical protein
MTTQLDSQVFDLATIEYGAVKLLVLNKSEDLQPKAHVLHSSNFIS